MINKIMYIILLLLFLLITGCAVDDSRDLKYVSAVNKVPLLVDDLDEIEIALPPVALPPEQIQAPPLLVDDYDEVETSLPPAVLPPTQIQSPPPSLHHLIPAFETCPIIIAEAFLRQYTSIFFGISGRGLGFAEPEEVFMMAYRQDIYDYYGRRSDWQVYFTDLNGYIIDDVPFIQNLYGAFSGDLEKAAPVAALVFHIFTIEGSDEPLLIIINFRAFQFTGGAYALFEIISDGTTFSQIGSMIPWASGGGSVPRATPFINESGEIIVYRFEILSSLVSRMGEADIFECISIIELDFILTEMGYWTVEYISAQDFAEILRNYEKNQQMQTNHRDLLTELYHMNFVPMVRMYELEYYLTEKITAYLRNVVPLLGRQLDNN